MGRRVGFPLFLTVPGMAQNLKFGCESRRGGGCLLSYRSARPVQWTILPIMAQNQKTTNNKNNVFFRQFKSSSVHRRVGCRINSRANYIRAGAIQAGQVSYFRSKTDALFVHTRCSHHGVIEIQVPARATEPQQQRVAADQNLVGRRMRQRRGGEGGGWEMRTTTTVLDGPPT